uniref:Uncharacterized protein n=1 Tax=Rhizophora mucronata TaxID=61149 RepID=A0A2P2PBG8_RHIMU
MITSEFYYPFKLENVVIFLFLAVSISMCFPQSMKGNTLLEILYVVLWIILL